MARRTPVRHGRAPFESRPSRRALPRTLHGQAPRHVGRTGTLSHWATSLDLSACPAGTVATHMHRLIGQCGDRGRGRRLASACFSDDVVTRTIGRLIVASQSGIVSGSGSSTQGPDHLHRIAPIGLWVLERLAARDAASAAPGAETRPSTRPAVHRRPRESLLIGGSITLSRAPTTAVRTAASRTPA